MDLVDFAGRRSRYDRALLLLGPKRNQVLTLPEVHGYGADSFGDPDYLRLYGMTPEQWYARGIRLLGRTAVECTRDDLAPSYRQRRGSRGGRGTGTRRDRH